MYMTCLVWLKRSFVNIVKNSHQKGTPPTPPQQQMLKVKENVCLILNIICDLKWCEKYHISSRVESQKCLSPADSALYRGNNMMWILTRIQMNDHHSRQRHLFWAHVASVSGFHLLYVVWIMSFLFSQYKTLSLYLVALGLIGQERKNESQNTACMMFSSCAALGQHTKHKTDFLIVCHSGLD